MTHQEYKSEYGIRHHVQFTVRGETKQDDVDHSGIIVAVKFTYANIFFDIIDDNDNKLFEKVPFTDIVGRISVQNEFMIDKRIPNEVEQLNNLYSEKIGCYGKIVFNKPATVMFSKCEADENTAKSLNLEPGKDYTPC